MKSACPHLQDIKTLAVFCLLAATAYPQAVTQPANSAPEKERPVAPVETVAAAEPDDEIISLNPFEVSATTDRGYQATETLAGTRIRTDLKDVGGALSVYTKEFLKDIGATDNATLLQYTTNAEVAGTRGTYAGLGNGQTLSETGTLREPSGAQRVRGLASADNTRDFFVTDIPWDSYNTDRIDIQRGPNSILFGLGSPAGIINASTRNAEFKTKGSLDARFGSYGTLRGSLDYNQVLIPKVLAIRIDGLMGNEKFQQEEAFQRDRRIYGAVRFDPKLFNNPTFQTSIKAKFEHGKIDANRPRIVPPSDRISPWFRPVSATPNMFSGLGKASVDYPYNVSATPSSTNPWFGGVGEQQQPIWIIDGSTAALQQIYSGFVNRGARNSDGSVRGSGDALVGQRYSGPFYAIASLDSYAKDANLPLNQYGAFKDMSLRDPSIFNFYDHLIDGPNKSEWENWDAYNVSFSQSGWDNRVGVEVNYDRQQYDRGGQGLINPTINIDILQTLQDFRANPNYGRPFVTGGPGSGNSYDSDREYIRGSLFGEVRATDFFDKESLLARILGKHRLNGVYSKETYSTETRGWVMNANPQDWMAYWTRSDGSTTTFTDRGPLAMIYLGPSLASASSAAGANIPGVTAPVTLANGGVYHFNSTWTGGTNYNDPWTVPNNLLPAYFAPTATPTALTQASNPANYVGWNSAFPMTLMRYNNGEDLRLLTGAQKTKRVTTSYAGSWQGYLWNEAIIPTLGWRYDEVESRGVTARPTTFRGFLNLSPTGSLASAPYGFSHGLEDLNTVANNQSYSIFKDHSTSGGVVVHINKLFGQHDVLPINASVSYNMSRNFQITNTRKDIYGNTLGNPTGETKDYSILLSTKDGKYSLRAVKYETTVENASISSSITALVGNPIQQGLKFRNVFLYKLSNYPWSSREDNGDRNTWAPAYIDAQGKVVAAGNVATPPTGATLQTQAQADASRDASIRAWNDIQTHFEAKGYFNYWGYTPTTASALTDRATYQAALGAPVFDPVANRNIAATGSQYLPNTATVFSYAYPGAGPQGLTMTGDTESKGYEFEFTANPTRSWRVSFNASRTEAVRMNVGGEVLDEFVAYMNQQMAGPAGDLRQFSGGYSASNEIRQNWNNQIANYTLLKLQQNAAAAELRKWRYNVVTNYSFMTGTLKGVGVGGSYRWQDKVIIGYPTIPGTGGQASFDLSKPYYGPSEDFTDLWLSYERKLTTKLNWKIQLNVRNAFAKEGLIPITVQPDGQTWAGVRTKPVQEWFVTNTLSF